MSVGLEAVSVREERVRISATYSFEAAHRLPFVPDGHKCKRLHGHNYRIDVSVEGGLDERGFVVDYAELDGVVQPIIEELDHCYLNDVPGLENPTSEFLALWLRNRIVASLPRFSPRVRVWETSRYWAEVS